LDLNSTLDLVTSGNISLGLVAQWEHWI
jgi:hypothetical protein